MKVTQTIENAGYGISGSIGGLPRTTYYTPDGRTVRAIAQMRDYVKRDKDGKVIGNGTRDANLDKGWLLQMPQIKKLYCPHCDLWHDTEIEIEACGIQQNKMIERLATQTKHEDEDKIASLENKIAELTALVEKLVGDKSGKVL